MHEPSVRDGIGEAVSKSIENLICCLVTTVPPPPGQKLQPFLYCLPKMEVLNVCHERKQRQKT